MSGRSGRLLRRAGLALAVAAAAAIVVVALAPVPRFDDLRTAAGSEALLSDRHGAPLQTLRVDRTRRQLDWTPLDAIAPVLVRAVVAAEDRRFGWHPGVDPLAVVAALRDNLHRERPRGASTLAMQLAALLHDDPAAAGVRRGLAGKLRQARDALALTARWRPEQVLEAYLNRVPFRGELVGVAAASEGLFGKAPHALDAAEAAVLAALVRAPGARPAVLERRACAVLHDAVPEASGCGPVAQVVAGLPRRARAIRGIDEAPHLARRLLAADGPAGAAPRRVRATVDRDVQRLATEALREQLEQLAGRNVKDGAAVVLDNATGDVLAWVGSPWPAGHEPHAAAAREVDGVTALRQPGSTMKPFLYAAAIDDGWLTAASLLDDAPLTVSTASGGYNPQNYDHRYRGLVSVRSALAGSLNVPAVRALSLLGVERFRQRLQALGLDTFDREATFYGAGLALGGGDATLLDLANAYRALANGGRWTPVRTRLDAPHADGEARQALGAAASFIVTDMLADPAARAGTFGLASPLSTRPWSAVKTGTSKGLRDNWAIGFTRRYTVAVWVGNASGEPMWDVSGISGAAPAWHAIVERLHEREPSLAPPAPPGVVRRAVRFDGGREPDRDEWFVAAPTHAPAADAAAPAARVAVARITVARLAPAATGPRILRPEADAVIAPDPDIPAARQVIDLSVSAPDQAPCVRLDRAPARCDAHRLRIDLPAPGRHTLALEARDGTRLDAVQFEVRPLAGQAIRTRVPPGWAR